MKEKDDFDIDFTDAIEFPVRRRDFLKLSGGGIFVLFTIGDWSALAQTRQREYPSDFNAYLRIGENGRVTCFTGKIEMGQGVITSLAQELAEELDVSLESIDMIMGDTDLCPYDRGTWGSRTTRFFGPALRAAGAEARAVLLQLAAEELHTTVGMLETENGFVFVKNKTNKIAYAQLAKGKKIERHLKTEPTVKKLSDLKVIGKPVERRDAFIKVTGEAKYAGDVYFPDMLYARLLRPPAHGAELLDVDISAAKSIKGVKVVQDGELIAVLHKYPDVADIALSKIKAKFSRPQPKVNDQNIFAHLLEVAPEGETIDQSGNMGEGEKQSLHIIDKIYYNSYVAHAPIETHTSLAKFEGDRVTVWASTQSPFGVKSQVAEALGISEDAVRIITPFVGGGFGGKSPNRQSIEAARLAKLTGKPVQVMWTRAEEFFYDTFRPAAVVKIKSGFEKSGGITLWDYHVYFAGSRGATSFYNTPNHQTISYGSGWRTAKGTHPFATGAWRAPANNTNTFARESQIDIMAAQAGIDPVDFRLLNLTDKKMRRVLKAADSAFDWKKTKPSGHGYGVACGIDSGTYVCVMAEVKADKKSGQVQVLRVVAAQDMGLVINPEGAKIQMEGCVTMGMGYALTEEIQFNGGEILNRNFDSYELPRFSWLPKIETVIVKSKEAAPQGGGEPVIICMGAVIANAIFDATGARLFQLPMTPERVKAAI